MLTDALGGLGAPAAAEEAAAGKLTLRLPSAELGPQASPHLLRVVDDGASSDQPLRLEPWEADAIRLPASATVGLLLSLPSTVPAGLAVGDSIRYLAEACKLALELVARGRLRPVLERRGERWVALWRPVTDDVADDARVKLLIRSMPPLLRAELSPWEEGNRPDIIVHGFLDAAVDACARELLQGRLEDVGEQNPAITGVLEAWLLGLVDEDPTVDGDPWELARLAEQLEQWWAAGQTYTAQRMFRTCFRLVPPDDADEAAPDRTHPLALAELDPDTGRIVDPDTWRVEFLLQHKDDPSVLVPAADVWAHSERLAALGRMLENPQERLLGGLGHALRLWSDLGPALEQAAPTAIELAAEQAYGFLREAVPLLEQAGFGVITPPWWRQRLQVKLSAQPEQEWGEGTGLFGVDGLCAYEWQVAIGDTTLTVEELEVLAELKLPLVKARGRWIALRAEDVEIALRFFKGRRAKGRASAAELLREGLGVQAVSTDEELPEIEIEAGGWLGELLRSGGERRLQTVPTPSSFVGQLRPYQQRGLAWLSFMSSLGLGACLADDMGLGKALAVDAKVLTPTGWRLMGDLRVGDSVIGGDGRATEVVGVYPQGVRQLYHVTFSDGASVEADADHLWAVRSAVHKHRGCDYSVVRQGDLGALYDAAGNARWYVPMVEPVRFAESGVRPLDAYLVGALLGDGGLSHRVMFSTVEEEMVERVGARLPAGVSTTARGGRDWCVVGAGVGRPNPVMDALRRLGLMGCRAETKFVPQAYLLAPPEERLELLRGLLDTDGYVMPGTCTVEYTTVSRQLAEDMRFMVQSLGGRASLREKPTTGQLAYRVVISLPRGVVPFALGRKVAAFRQRSRYEPTRAIVSIQPSRRAPAVCIKVAAPDGLFVVDDFVVTHNTIQLLALMLAEREPRAANGAGNGRKAKKTGPTLLVCPVSVADNWRREAARFAPSLTVHVHYGRERLKGPALARVAKHSDIVITTYALALRDRETLQSIEWDRIVLDEAQNIKTREAKQTRAIRALHARHRVALTGTPVENRLGELHSIMDFLNPGLLGSATSFREQFSTPIERWRDGAAAKRLRRATGPFILRRLKTDKDIISDLPEKIEMRVDCHLTTEQATLYQAVVDEMLERVERVQGIARSGIVLQALMKLKQVCNHPAHLLKDRSRLDGRSDKLARLEEILEEALAEGDKALCFTQFAEFGHQLRGHLQERLGREVLFLHGGTPKAARDQMVRRFQSPDGPSLFVLSLKAGGTGLNLTAANHVVHFDRWWNPAVEDQATDRAFRIGQRKNVQVRKLSCVGTLEERIDRLIAEKRDLAEQIVGSGEAWLTELDTAQLRELVALTADALVAG